MTFRTKLLASYSGVLLPMLGLLIYGYMAATEDRIESTIDAQMRAAEAVAALVDANFDEALVLAKSLSSNPLVRTFAPSRLDPFLEQFAASYPQYEVIGIVNKEGDNVGVSTPFPPGSDRTRLAADRPYFQELMTTGQPVISPILVSRATFRPTIVVATPIRDEAGNVTGAVLVTSYLAALSDRLQTITRRRNQEILLIDKSGKVAFHTKLKDLLPERSDLSSFEPIKTALNGRASGVRRFASPLLHDIRIAAFVPSPKYGWVVGVTIQEDVALASVQIAARNQLLGFAAVGILTIGVALFMSNLLLRPVQHLTRHAHALAEGDLSQRVEIGTGDQMEEMGDAFNYLAERLSRALSELRATFDATEAAILMYDHDLIVRLVNRRMAEWFNLDPARIVGQRIHTVAADFIAPKLADPSKLLARIGRLVEHPTEPIFDEVEVVQPEHRVYQLYIGPVQSDSQPIGHIAVCTDITAIRRHESERRALGQVAEALVRERTLGGIAEVVVDEGRRVLKANTVSLFLVDRKSEELRLLAYRGLSAESVAELRQSAFSAPTVAALVARTGRPQEVPDVAAAGPELAGTRRIAGREGQRSILGQPIFSKEQLLGVITVALPAPHRFTPWERQFTQAFADLCSGAIDNAHVYEELEGMLQLREEFISAAAHELKTPVTTIKGYIQMLRKAAPEGHEPREGLAFEIIDRQCDRMASRVQEMIQSVRLGRAASQRQPVKFELGELVAEVVEHVQTATERCTLIFKREAHALVEADRERIEEVLASLLDNAIMFMPEGGNIEIRVLTQDGKAIVAVKDQGVGISKDRQPHVFEPFYEPAAAGAPGYRGVVALSLHLSKLIIERHNGRIWCESEESVGSTFYFSLPIAEAPNGGVEGRTSP